VGKAPGGLQSRQQIAAVQQRQQLGGAGNAVNDGGASMTPADAQAAVAANLARLANARKAAGQAVDEQVSPNPPQSNAMQAQNFELKAHAGLSPGRSPSLVATWSLM
jgi:hypothetical protein